MTIGDFDRMPRQQLTEKLLACCGSHVWVEKMISILPVEDMIDLFQYAEEKWYDCSETDWKEAFAQQASSLQEKAYKQADSSHNNLGGALGKYEQKFGYHFIANATGKSNSELMAAVNERLQNDPADEIKIAAAEQVAITRIKLENLLQQE